MATAASGVSVAYDPSPAMRWFLAALSLGAAVIHLVMVPQHAQESLRMGLAFAAAGWFQVAFGVAVLARPTRLWVQLAIAANLVFFGVWMLSRTVGLPTWTGDGGVDKASATDILTIAFEIGIVLGGLVLLAAPTPDATRDGWFMGSRSLYGIGAHYVRGNVLSGAATFDLLNPNILLFDGDGPDAKFAGVSYTVADEPEGFAGDHEVWHSHTSVCRQGGSIISLSEEGSPVWLSESECRARGGQVFPLSNAEMMHLWIGPDYIDGAPIFAHDHPELYDGYHPKRDA